MSDEDSDKQNPTARFYLRGGHTIDVEDDTIEEAGDIWDRLRGPARLVQFGDAVISNLAVSGAELL